MTKNPPTDASLPKGIHRSWKLPDASLGASWDSIVMDEARKKQLLSQAIVNFTVRPKVEHGTAPAWRDIAGWAAGNGKDLLGARLGASCG